MQVARTHGVHIGNSTFWLVSAFFLLSGLSSLIYQIIWTRLLVFVFGSTTFATSTVLAVFMGGLALGSFLAGKKADKLNKPFFVYGVLEGVIGLWALATPFFFAAALPIYKSLFLALHEQQLLFAVVRFLVASVILIPPTACMGATLPLLSRFVSTSLSTVGDRIGTLYSLNTLGAVFGAFLAGFVLLPEFGLSITTLIAASINILLAVSVCFTSKKLEIVSAQNAPIADLEESPRLLGSESGDPADPDTAHKLSGQTKVTMLCFAISGALAMIYEVAWTRCLLMVIGSTTYAFSVMLCTFLIGIFLGSYFCAKFVDRLRDPILFFAIAEMGICLVALVSMVCFSCLPYWNLLFALSFAKDQWMTMFFRFLSSAMILVPITLFLGAIFPIVVKICTNDIKRIGNSIGNLYAVNTVGAIFGAFLAGFIVIPGLGSEQALLVTSVANLLLGLVLLLSFGKLRNSIKIFMSIGVVAVLFWTSTKPQIWDRTTLSYAQAQRRHIVSNPSVADLRSVEDWRKTLESQLETLFYKDGICSTVAVSQAHTPPVRVLFTNGHADASDRYDMENQAMLASFPLLLRPDSKDVCVVGWGSGVTVGYALSFPVQKAVCVELEPAVLETSKLFHHVNMKPEDDPRTVEEPSDGRNFLLCTPDKYDVVISEPSNPWQAGVCNLFTKEYFQICKDSLKPNGVFTMWTQISELPTDGLMHILSALKQVFPYVFVLDTGSGDVCAIASNEALSIKPEIVNKALAIPRVKKSLGNFGIKTFEDFVGRFNMCPPGIAKAVEQYPANVDDKNFLEYQIAKSYENKSYRAENTAWMSRNQGPIWDFISWNSDKPEAKALEYAKVGERLLLRDPVKAVSWANASLKLKPNGAAFSVIAQAQMITNNLKKASKVLSDGLSVCKNDAHLLGLRGSLALKLSDYANARLDLKKASELDPENSLFKFWLAQAYSPLDLGQQVVFTPPSDPDPAEVIKSCASVDDSFESQQPAVLFLLGKAYLDLGKYQEAITILSKATKIIPNAYLPWRLLGQAYAEQRDWARSNYCYDKSQVLVFDQLPKILLVAEQMKNAGNENGSLQNYQLALEMSSSNRVAYDRIVAMSKTNQKAQEVLGRWKNELRASGDNGAQNK